MRLKELLKSAPAAPLPLPAKAPILAGIAEDLARQFSDRHKAPSPDDVKALEVRFRTLAGAGWPEVPPPRDWRKVVWVAFNGQGPLAEIDGFLTQLFSTLKEAQRRSAYKNLILAYLGDFEPSHAFFRDIAVEVAIAARLYDWPWRERHEQTQLFDFDIGTQALASACIESIDGPAAVLESLGFPGSRIGWGMPSAAFLVGLQRLEKSLTQRNPDSACVDAILEWATLVNGFSYPQHRPALAEALLLPWLEREPEEYIKDRISRFLLEHYHDPRTKTQHWLWVREDAISVMRRWLTQATLDQFFELLDQIAEHNMWKYRRSFWNAYFKRGVLDEAWVALGPEAQRYTTRQFGDMADFAVLRGAGVQNDHAVLLMRIGKLVVADWSHNGKCHVWLDGNSRAPRLYCSSYAKASVTTGSDNGGVVHAASEHYHWQRKVAAFIEERAGVRIAQTDYRLT